VFVENVGLRPIERRVLRLNGEGVSVTEIARRFRRSSDHIDRVIGWARLPGRDATDETEILRPVERCVLHWRDRGVAYEDIAPRLRRSPAFVERVEGFARYKLLSR
jgi:hypothetical protein